MASTSDDTAAHFQEPISPTTSNDAPASAPTENNTKPSITGIIKNAVTAPPAEQREAPPAMEQAIEAIGDDGGKKGV